MGAALEVAFVGCPYDKMIKVWDGNYDDEYKFHFPPKDDGLAMFTDQSLAITNKMTSLRSCHS